MLSIVLLVGMRARRISVPMLVSLIAALVPGGALDAVQEATILQADLSPLYEIELAPGPVLTSDGIDDPYWVSDVGDLDLMSDGRLAIAEFFSDRILVTSITDDEAQWVGRRGEGPGEYRYIRWVRASGNHLHVFDAINMRRTVLNADFEVEHTHPLQFVDFGLGLASLGDSAYVMNATIRSSDRVGYALHLFDGQGMVVNSFDEIPGGYGLAGAVPGPYRRLAVSQDGGVWSAPESEYRIDLWDPGTGDRRRSLVREADWFPAHDGTWSLTPDQPRPPRIGGVREDDRGWLWVLIHVASEHWRECLEETPSGAPAQVGEYRWREHCRGHDSRLEVLDPDTGRIMAAQTFPQSIVFVLPRGNVVSLEYDALGFPVLQLYHATLRAAGNNK